jgi:hypothetical protein
MGEGEGGGGQNEFSPPPLHPLPPGEGRFFEEYVSSIMDSLVNPFGHFLFMAQEALGLNDQNENDKRKTDDRCYRSIRSEGDQAVD